MVTLRDVIRETTHQHLNAGYAVFGQCLSAVGWVGGTVPDHPRLTELPMSDVAQSGFLVGAALAGKRPIYVVRYQGFQHLNAALIVNYAAKSKSLWRRPCPLLVRSIAMEGLIGPTSGSSHHSLFTRMPGIIVRAPMTPVEWTAAYDEWMVGDDPMYLSEHRGAYNNEDELPDTLRGGDITLYPISITRFAADQAATDLAMQGINVNVMHICKLKPLNITYASTAKYGIVLDDDYAGGTASDVAQQIHVATGAQMRVLALEDRTAGFSIATDNLPPNADRIKRFILDWRKTWD